MLTDNKIKQIEANQWHDLCKTDLILSARSNEQL